VTWRDRYASRDRDVSRSMVALVVSLAALALLGLATNLPGWLGRGDGFTDVEPGLLTVAPDAKGVATLGGGLTVSLYSDGMRIRRGDDLLLQTVIGGSILSAVEGTARTDEDGRPTERVTRSLDNVTIDELVFLPGRATYFGHLSDGSRQMPLVLRIESGGSTVKVSASVNGADGVVWHLDHESLTTGIRPALRGVNLRNSASWIAPATVAGRAAFSTILGTDVGVGPQRVARGVDVRSTGRTDVHIWSDSGYLTVSSHARPQPTSTS
jgi:hypothetical protein